MRQITVEGGDTLSSIALKTLGNANRWPEIFRANRAGIVAEQKRRNIGRIVGEPLHEEDWIFPGFTLALPDK